ncbi:hypothetical protein [Pseudoalteromonas sp. G4]|uniref:hypothetical protein n=1 Tax=Pseudoalteromonas sp. G4 TaxID=2992761 RepID=UPI00237E2DE7|nr:hypothetical protein [Pseudoalteromonas sp. G4]MDE3271382.1 hypothetical protein [Pseudoalteromonas sp. G4]
MANTYIQLPYSQGENNLGKHNDGFWSDALKRYLLSLNEKGVAIAARNCTLAELKENGLEVSLDYFLRTNFVKYPDIKQAVTSVREDLIKTGDFEIRTVSQEGRGKNPEWIFVTNDFS